MQPKPRTAKQLEAARKAREARHDQSLGDQLQIIELALGVLRKGNEIELKDLALKVLGEDNSTNRRHIDRKLEKLCEKGNAYGLARIARGRTISWKIKNPDKLSRQLDTVSDLSKALAADLASKFLKDILPPGSYEELQPYFDEANKKLADHVARNQRRNLLRLKQRVEVAQRGQALVTRAIDKEVLGTIYEAIMQNRCIDITYRQSEEVLKTHNELHPAAVVIKPPKFFLYAGNGADLRSGKKNPYRAYQVNLIEDITLSATPCAVPGDFNLKDYIKSGFTDVLYDAKDRKRHRIIIRVFERGNLVRDLHEYPLYHWKRLEKTKGKDYWELELEASITHQLVSYIVERGESFQVMDPPELVEAVQNHLREALQRYNKKTPKTPKQLSQSTYRDTT